ncbi:MAG: hypothetical protein LBU74_06070 [Methanobacteriaceae archaeon]|jgi:hypothetical protein|nr:hypothetical protein [Candidatus Methanorudis spinitermitis]
MVEVKRISVIKMIIFMFLGTALLYSLYLGERDIVLAIVAGIFGYIAKDPSVITDNTNDEDKSEPIEVEKITVNKVETPNDEDNFVME